MLARGEAQRDANNAIVGLRGVAMDITDSRAAADALARSAQTFRLAMDGAPQGMAGASPPQQKNSRFPRARHHHHQNIYIYYYLFYSTLLFSMVAV